jgi:carboxypeptidase PM20D1
MRYPERLLFANRWLFDPFITRFMTREAASAALVRTTVAPTQLQASSRDNVLPPEARATLNLRLHPRDSLDGTMQRLRDAIDDPKVKLQPHASATEPSAVSPTDSDEYRAIEQSVREIFPETIVAPGLFIALSDSRHFRALTNKIYRFSPLQVSQADLGRFHGTDERIAVHDYSNLVRYYRRLFEHTLR